jgi:uncharacterized small protein (DUF1192 family)
MQHNALCLANVAGRRNAPVFEDDDAKPKPRRLQELRLDPLGVVELESYIVELREEIARTEAEIGRKRGHRNAADAFFKPG